MSKDQSVIPIERIAASIYLIRGEKVMLDSDLAELYGVETGALVRAMKRNIERFPDDFSFQLTKEEFENLKCQIGISSQWGGRRTPPYAFTEHGALMLSSVLRSARAVEISISVVRTFTRLREMLALHKDVARKIEEHDRQIANLYAHVERLLTPATNKKNPIGYIWDKEHTNKE
ncbi:MAG: ORF6N domain-containing protein [Candidatus Thiodiazotropha endolucinida]|nr:ORF6N domain-containing protein [Candidatus Thiodiazotropha endolucinida]